MNVLGTVILKRLSSDGVSVATGQNVTWGTTVWYITRLLLTARSFFILVPIVYIMLVNIPICVLTGLILNCKRQQYLIKD